MFLRRDGGEMAVVAQLASGTTGHPSILHGGITALLFDEGMGWMCAAYRLHEHGRLRLLNDPDCPDASDIRKKSVGSVTLSRSWAPPCEKGGQRFLCNPVLLLLPPLLLLLLLLFLQVATFGFTANLHVNYRRPCFVRGENGTVVVLRARVSQADCRKLYLEADLKSPDGAETFADATCLYVQPKPKQH